MGIATEILDLRHNQFSSVTTLLSALERLHEASPQNRLGREFQVYDAVDIALTNIAAHVGEAVAAFQSGSGRTKQTIPIRPRLRTVNAAEANFLDVRDSLAGLFGNQK
jgi:hypothetical protein